VGTVKVHKNKWWRFLGRRIRKAELATRQHTLLELTGGWEDPWDDDTVTFVHVDPGHDPCKGVKSSHKRKYGR
jgi:hypothetical protein